MLRIRWYYPWGTKVVPYDHVKGVRSFQMTALRGSGVFGGGGNFKYWANLDTKRPQKKVGLLIDVGRKVQPFITPDDAAAVEALLRERANLGPDDGTNAPSPFI